MVTGKRNGELFFDKFGLFYVIRKRREYNEDVSCIVSMMASSEDRMCSRGIQCIDDASVDSEIRTNQLLSPVCVLNLDKMGLNYES